MGNEHAKTHGMSRTPTYQAWKAILSRCNNSNDPNWDNYGGRGVGVCSEWMVFENFYQDMGKQPKGLTIDRIDNNKGYCKNNCKWSTSKEQNNNMRSNRLLDYKGIITLTMSQWAEALNIPISTLANRVYRGWTIERMLETKPGGGSWDGN